MSTPNPVYRAAFAAMIELSAIHAKAKAGDFNNCQSLHQAAMTLWEKKDDPARAMAFRMEAEAAFHYFDRKDAEPSRSILFRSAGSMAVALNRRYEAEAMALFGLDGNPPEPYRAELQAILESLPDLPL